MASAANSSWSGSGPHHNQLLCNHKLPAEINTSKSESNPGRRYYRCPNWKFDDCKFFKWLDPGLSPNQQSCYQRLKMEIDNLQEQLKCKGMIEDVQSERLQLKSDECEALKNSLEESRFEVENLQLDISKLSREVMVMKIVTVIVFVVMLAVVLG